MAVLDSSISPIAGLIDKIILDPKARDAAKLELLKLEGSQDLDTVRMQLNAIVAEANSVDPWTSRAPPVFPLCHVRDYPVGDPDGPDRRPRIPPPRERSERR